MYSGLTVSCSCAWNDGVGPVVGMKRCQWVHSYSSFLVPFLVLCAGRRCDSCVWFGYLRSCRGRSTLTRWSAVESTEMCPEIF